jgi:acetyl-CoA carboxylase biotin carboxyl carrier protein
MKLDEIKEIIELMTAHGLTEFEKEEDGVRLAIKRGGAGSAVAPVPAPLAAAPVQVVAAAPAPAAAAPAPAVVDERLAVIKAPFVGTFYRASTPDAEPYVKVGQEVGPEAVLCIVEAMKVMNEIKAEVRGIVREILVENAHAVQFGQPLFKIEKT